MKQFLNTLFVTREDSYLAKDGANVVVRHDGAVAMRVPLHNLGGIVCLGWNIGASPALMGACAEAGMAISFLTPNGKFLAAVHGFTSGNVLLRRQQYRVADDLVASARLAREMVAAKILNSRASLMRYSRDRAEVRPSYEPVLNRLGQLARDARLCDDLDRLRGLEGEAADLYFRALPAALSAGAAPDFTMRGRQRRPPTDRFNALLSFLYTLLTHDVRSACESTGLDSAVGFLHRDRPGRPSLALDLMEELRPLLADRLAISLVNLRQLQASDFETQESGAVFLKEASRKTLLTAYQNRKKEELLHPFLGESISLGLLPHIQARLLARHLRGDMDAYPPFVWR